MLIRLLLAAFLLVAAPAVVAQSADLELVSVTESADPVAPGTNVSYTIVLRNNGPSAAANAGIAYSHDGNLEYQAMNAPAGFSCFVGFGAGCTTPSLASGATANFVLTMRVGAARANSPDGSTTLVVTATGTTVDPNGANNRIDTTTSWDSASIDVGLAVVDSPDPVAPGGDITYTATVTQAGPDSAKDVNFSVYHAQGLKFRSLATPAGFSCVPPAPNGTPIFTCTRATMPPGSSVFTVVLRADPENFGVRDGAITVNFTASGTGYDAEQANNAQNVTTAYVAPDANLAVSASDSPDPVAPDGDITYTITGTNAGPDAAGNVSMSVYNAMGLQFRSLVAPAGFTCTPPASNAPLIFSCTAPVFANAANATFTVVARAPRESFGGNDGTINTVFTFNSAATFDPDGTDNMQQVSTAYVAPDADLSVVASDSPDPVVAGNTITYSATITNDGPDAAPTPAFNVYNNGVLRFESVTASAPFACTPPASGAGLVFGCSAPSLAVGASATFTVVARIDADQVGIHGGTVSTVFTMGSAVADPDNTDNLAAVETAVLSDRLLSDGFE